MKKGIKRKFNASEAGLAAGIFLIVASSAYMNISGWLAMAETPQQMRANGVLSSGFELTALFALPHAGRVMGRGTYFKALLALAIGAFAIGVNIYATQNFLFEQLDLAGNALETAQGEVGVLSEKLADLETERNSIMERNNGVPRDEQTIRDAYDSLPEEDNPINAMRRDSEIGDRRRYEELSAQIDAQRDASVQSSVVANDSIRSVIPPEHIKGFVTALEIMKGVGLFVIGKNRLFFRSQYLPNGHKRWTARKRKAYTG